MSNFISHIHINKIFHLENLDVCLSKNKRSHLLLTGKNGSGKTSLLNAIMDFIEIISTDTNLNFIKYRENLKFVQEQLLAAEKKGDKSGIAQNLHMVNVCQTDIEKLYGKVDLEIQNIELLGKNIREGKFIVAYYRDLRTPQFVEHKTPQKPDMTVKPIHTSKVDQFVDLLTHYQLQTAFAQLKDNEKRVSSIGKWFGRIEDVFRGLFDDRSLILDFDSDNYSLYIVTKGKRFKFTQLSAGYAAALDIIADLIFKMQSDGNLVDIYDKEGIVLIDEVETHLHLELQRQIMPLLTSVFPNIQFIVSTHSPFVLNSITDAVAYDMERHEVIGDLTNYSYESLAEGYFGVKTSSMEIEVRLERLEELLSRKLKLGVSEQDELRRLIADFENLPELVAPSLKARYYEVTRRFNQ